MRAWLLIVMALLLGVLSTTAQAYRLQFKDVAGAARTYKMEMNIAGAMQGMGMNLPIRATMNLTSTEKVTAVRDGKATITFAMTDGNIVTKVSGIPGQDEPQTIEQKMPAFTMTYSRSPLGMVSDVTYSDDIAQLMGGQMGMPGQQIQYPGQGIEFPDRELNIGDSWSGKQTMEIAPGNKIDVTVNYKLNGTQVVAGKTYLQVLSDFTVDIPSMKINVGQPQQGTEQMPEMSMSMKMAGKTTTLFDEQAGVMYATGINANMAMTMSMGGADAGAFTTTMAIDGKMAKQ